VLIAWCHSCSRKLCSPISKNFYLESPYLQNDSPVSKELQRKRVQKNIELSYRHQFTELAISNYR